MNKQEKYIVDVLTFDEIEKISDIFLGLSERIDKTIGLIASKELIEYVMADALFEDHISVKKVDLELDDVEYMISIDNNGNMVVQPIVFYNNKYFSDIEYAFINMDGDVQQMTIDNLLNRDVPIVLFGYEDACGCDECECACKKDEKATTTSTTSATYRVNGKEVDKDTYEKALNDLDEKYLDNVQDMLLNYFDFVSEMNEWRKLLGW